MRRYFVFSLALLIILASCHRKTVPEKNVNSTVVYPGNKNNGTVNGNPATPANPNGTTTPAPVTTTERILVILDKGGRATDPSTLPPYVQANTKQLPPSTPLTPTERNNLLARQKTLLPIALYVPDAYAGKSPRGQFYKYKSKFWYWKKADGFYYLDEIYYK